MQIEKYLAKISSPLIDRIAIHVTVQPVDLEMWSSSSSRMSSVEMRDRVARAREIQALRYKNLDGVDCNSRLPDGLFARFCGMDASAEALFVKAQKSLLVSARARGHIVRVARTIADLEGRERITERHIGEGLSIEGAVDGSCSVGSVRNLPLRSTARLTTNECRDTLI